MDRASTTFGQELFSVPWSHIKPLINKRKGNRDEALFYVHKVVENNWSHAVLASFIDTNLYECLGKSNLSLGVYSERTALCESRRVSRETTTL